MEAELFVDWIKDGMKIYFDMLESADDATAKASGVYLKTVLETLDEKEQFKVMCEFLGTLLKGLSES